MELFMWKNTRLGGAESYVRARLKAWEPSNLGHPTSLRLIGQSCFHSRAKSLDVAPLHNISYFRGNLTYYWRRGNYCILPYFTVTKMRC